MGGSGGNGEEDHSYKRQKLSEDILTQEYNPPVIKTEVILDKLHGLEGTEIDNKLLVPLMSVEPVDSKGPKGPVNPYGTSSSVQVDTNGSLGPVKLEGSGRGPVIPCLTSTSSLLPATVSQTREPTDEELLECMNTQQHTYDTTQKQIQPAGDTKFFEKEAVEKSVRCVRLVVLDVMDDPNSTIKTIICFITQSPMARYFICT